MTLVVNLYRESYDVYIGRAGRGQDGYFGNPFTITDTCSRDDVLASFERYFSERVEKEPEFRARVLALRGKRLGCFCKPNACHGDIIVRWLEANGQAVGNLPKK